MNSAHLLDCWEEEQALSPGPDYTEGSTLVSYPRWLSPPSSQVARTPSPASSGGQTPETVHVGKGSQPSVVWRPKNQLPTCLPKACNLEIIVIITPHIWRALFSISIQFCKYLLCADHVRSLTSITFS